MRAALVVASFLVAVAAGCASPQTETAHEPPKAATEVVEKTAAAAPAPAKEETAMEQPSPPARPTMMFAVRHTPGPKWAKGVPANEQEGIGEHAEYVGGLHEKGVVFGAGPFMDGTGGMTVLLVKSMDEAKAVVDADPAVKCGLLVPEIHPWLVVFRGK